MKKHDKLKVVLSGGGTGGHIFPAISIADQLKKRFPQVEILFIGAKGKMEMQKVPAAGYKIKGLWISGIQRRITLENLLFPFKLLSSLIKSFVLITKFKPNVVIGTGGFASGPALMVASLKNIPTLIQEQNSYPGITNRLLGKIVDSICVAYDNLDRFFPKEKLIKTGNPIRQDLVALNGFRSEDLNNSSSSPETLSLLVLGGSLGAKSINDLVADNLSLFESLNVELVWQCGKLYYDKYNKYNANKGVQVYQFLEDMASAYSSADIIISRAGASSVSELCVVGKPVIFIPSPNVAEDHQTKNALAIQKANGAILIKESELQLFPSEFQKLIIDKKKQNILSENINKLARPDATLRIVDEIERLLRS